MSDNNIKDTAGKAEKWFTDNYLSESGSVENTILNLAGGGKEAVQTLTPKQQITTHLVPALIGYSASGGNGFLSVAAGLAGGSALSTLVGNTGSDNRWGNYIREEIDNNNLLWTFGSGTAVQAITGSKLLGAATAITMYGARHKFNFDHMGDLFKTGVKGITDTVSKAPEKLAEMAGDTKGAEEYKAKREAKAEAKETKNAEYDEYVEKATSADNSEKRTSERFTATTSTPSSQSTEKTAEKIEEQCDVGV